MTTTTTSHIAAFVQPAALLRLVAAAAALLTLPCSPIPNTRLFTFIVRRSVVVEPRRRIIGVVLHAEDIDRRLEGLDKRGNVKGHPPAGKGTGQKDGNDDAMSLLPFRTRKIHDNPSTFLHSPSNDRDEIPLKDGGFVQQTVSHGLVPHREKPNVALAPITNHAPPDF